MNAKLAKIAGIFIVSVMALGACSSGSGGGETGTSPPPPPPPVGGITRTGIAVAVGPITAFGSVVVNGIRYDTSSAEFTVDGKPGIQSDLAVGDVIVVKGTIDDDNTNAVAETVEFDDNVEGPVSSVNNVANSLMVLGQSVQIGAATSIDDSCPATLDELLNVAAVEVSGQVLGDGSIQATRIECRSVAGEMEVTGIVSNLAADTFMINNLTVDFTAVPAILEDFQSGAIGEGDLVEAKGDSLGAAGELLATRVEFKGARFAENEGDHVEVEGFITRFVSATDFDVSGIPVTTVSGTTVFEGGVAGDLGLNLKIEVEGEFDGAGVLVATKVELKQATSIRVTAEVDSVSGDSLIILGISVDTDAQTRFEDKSDMKIESFGIGDINPGDYLEVRGQEFPGGSGVILATQIERDDPDTEAIVQGFIAPNGVSRPAITVFDVTIETNNATVFQNNDGSIIGDPDEFWSRISEGSLIKAKGTESSSQTLTADEVEIQEE